MDKTIIGIRCVKYDKQTEDMYNTMKKIFPEHKIFFIVDSINKTNIFPKGYNTLDINIDVLKELSLYYEDSKIAWKAGDYSYYVSLKYDWDYMWLIEPDVYISSDLYNFIKKIDQKKEDLITTKYGERNSNWIWKNRLVTTTQFKRVWWSFFPLTRVSRTLVESSYEVRKEITKNLRQNSDLLVPNDESVIGTVTHWKKLSVLNLSKEYPHIFSRFDFNIRNNYNDIINQSGIFHPVDNEQKFKKEVFKQLEQLLDNSPIKHTLSRTTTKTRNTLLNEFFEM